MLHRICLRLCYISIHAPREGSDVRPSAVSPGAKRFLSTLPARGATGGPLLALLVKAGISIHAPREGSDALHLLTTGYSVRFLSTLPARGATQPHNVPSGGTAKFLSTLPARGATKRDATLAKSALFLSTLPARGATRRSSRRLPPHTNFYPRSPRGERRSCGCATRSSRKYFYPRSPLGERQPKHVKTGKRGGFLSTLPARGATRILADLFVDNEISIHAPREGSDLLITDMVLPSCYFYPRSPRGERPDKVAVGEITLKFLSTLPARGATQRRPPAPPAERFLSTLPARGATISPPSLGVAGGFLSTLPARGATRVRQAQAVKRPQISIHAPREGSDSTA